MSFCIFTRRKSSPAPDSPAHSAIVAAAVDCSMTAVDSDASSKGQQRLHQQSALLPPPVPPQVSEQAASAADALARAGAADAAGCSPPAAASGFVQRHRRFRLPSSRVVSHTRHALTRHAKQLARKANEHEQLITKVTYSLGVLGFGIFCFLLGSRPQDIPFVYAAFFLVATPLRWVYYRAKKWHYFLLDFCYYANVICTFYLLFFSKNEKLFLVCFAFSEGPLAWALIVWRCSLVFSSLDKIVSVLIHLLPGTVIFIIRWWDPATLAHHAADETGPWPAWPQVDSARELWLWMLAVPLAAYAAWQIVYWAVVHGLRNKRLLRDPEVLTSFRELSRKASRANNVWWKLSGVLGDDRRFLMYGLLQALFTIATMALTVAMFQSYRFHMAFQFFKVITSVWNGGNFFLEVMPRQLQSRAAARRHQHSPLRHASRSSGGSSSSLCADGAPSDGDAAVSLRAAAAAAAEAAAATTATDFARCDTGVSCGRAEDAALVCNGKAVCVATTDESKADLSSSLQLAGLGAAAAAASATPLSRGPVRWQTQQQPQQLLLRNFKQQVPGGQCSVTTAGYTRDDAPRCSTCGQPLPCTPLLPSELCLSPDASHTGSLDRPGSSTELEAGRGRGNGSWQDHPEQHFQHARRHSWDCDADTQGEPSHAEFRVHLSATDEALSAKAMAPWEGMRRRTGWQQQSDSTHGGEGNRTGSGRWQASPHLGSVPCAG